MLFFRKHRRFWFPTAYDLLLKKQVLKKHTMAGKVDAVSCSPVEDSKSTLPKGYFDPSSWKIMNSRYLGIDNSQVDIAALNVLKVLKNKGFGAYLVGGCVRDLILHKIPKDFDIVTTADLIQIKKLFHNAIIVGHRFPICLVHLKNSCIEVSSFKTKNKKTEASQTTSFQSVKGLGDVNLARWRDCMRRDFTINGLFYDPTTNKVYDYVNGIRDTKQLTLHTIMPADMSFKEDCARVLRGIRIAARLGLKFSRNTKMAMLNHSQSIVSLPAERLMLEMNYMLAYGAAVSSICLLQRFKLLDILLPFHTFYLSQRVESQTTKGSTLLMNLFSKMDAILSANQPSSCHLWLGLLAFHMALVQYPKDSTVVWAFSFILCRGNLNKAIKSAKENAKSCSQFFPEISCFSEIKSDELLIKEVPHFVSLVKSSIMCLMSKDALLKALEAWHISSSSCKVFVSKNMGRQVAKLFDLDSKYNSNSHRESDVIDYNLLKKGESNETRFVLGKVIMDVLNDRIKPGIEQSSHMLPEVVNGLDASGSGIQQGQKKHFQQQKDGGDKMVSGLVQNKPREILKEVEKKTHVCSKEKRKISELTEHDDFKHEVVERKFKRRKQDQARHTDIQPDIQNVSKLETNLKKKGEQESCEVPREEKNEPKSLLSKLFM